jgi:hypothetical protein
VTTKIARLMAPTCYEESSLSIHGGNDVRFACFWQRPGAVLVNEDCSGRPSAAAVWSFLTSEVCPALRAHRIGAAGRLDLRWLTLGGKRLVRLRARLPANLSHVAAGPLDGPANWHSAGSGQVGLDRSSLRGTLGAGVAGTEPRQE